MNPFPLLQQILLHYQKILGNHLTGFYVHGSIAFGCFHWNQSDIDFIVTVDQVPTMAEKEALIRCLLDCEEQCPPKGVEMSVVLDQYCRNFMYPTPFELHYSITHRDRCQSDLTSYCRTMHGTDPDLAAHFTVIRKAGIALYGPPIAEMFGPVPREDYLDSILRDIQDAEAEIDTAPVYLILNLCRVLAYLREGEILSKEQGGRWGLSHLSAEYAPAIQTALNAYRGSAAFRADAELLHQFAGDMLEQIHMEIL